MSLELNMNKQHLNALPVIKLEFTDNVNQLTDLTRVHHLKACWESMS